MFKVEEMVGRRFGLLTVTGRELTNGNGARWACLCDCGTKVIHRGNVLRAGQVKSCGCRRVAAAWSREKRDLTGAVFGWLTVIEECKDDNRRRSWVCECRCGKRTIVRTGLLSSGNTKSCGCGQTRHCNRAIRDELAPFSGVYAIVFNNGAVKFGCAANVPRRLKGYHREVILGGGATYLATRADDRLVTERRLLLAAGNEFRRVSKELFQGASMPAVERLFREVTRADAGRLLVGRM